ncbi:MAG: efflux RND transporter permease subunit [Myxococcales bacterium]|nr:efflux RND transporter permease subunit [Myxococcales bacterium]
MTGPEVRGGRLVAFSLNRPVTVSMALLALLVVGAIAYLNIPVELIPSGFTPPFLYVEVPTLRSAPADVEENVAIPVEEMLATVRNVESLGTRIRSNRASFFMEFADGTDMDVAYNQVRDRIDRVLPTLDDQFGQYFVWKYNPSDEALLWFAVTFPEDLNAAWFIENLIVRRLERVPGVSRVEFYGVPSRVVSVRVDDRLAQAAGPGIGGVIQRLSADNFSEAAGAIDAEGSRLPLRVTSRYQTLGEIDTLPIGNGLRLSDVATVDVQDRYERAIYRVNREPSVFLAVYKESTANTVDVSRRVREAVDTELRGDARLEGFDYAYFFDQGGVIEDSLSNLTDSAIQGAFFALFVLLFFLRRAGMTLLITLAIPTSLLATIVTMYFWGRTLNVLSLTGLMLSVGMVVDNSIVVVESIQAQLQRNVSAREAAYRGAADVALAIVVSTLTTVVVFLPLILMNGSETVSFYLSQIGMPVCVALVASLVVSLVFIPLAASLRLGTAEPAVVPSVEALQRRYGRALRWAVRHRVDAFIIAALVFGSMFVVKGSVPRTDKQEPNINDFRVFVTLDDALTWDEKVRSMLTLETALWEQREALGIEHLLVRLGGPWGRPQVRAFLVPPDDRPMERDAIIERATSLLPQQPGVSWSLDWSSDAGAADSLQVRIVGRDSRTLAGLAVEAERRLRLLDGVTSVRSESGDDGSQELRLVVDRDRALSMGMSAFVVGGAVDFALRGRELDPYRGEGQELPILVEGALDASHALDDLNRLQLPSPTGASVALGDVTDSSIASGYESIDRQDRRTVVSLTIRSTRDDVEALGKEVRAALDQMEWPRGYGPELGGRFEGIAEDQQDQNFAVLLAIVFVFLLMGVLFESVVLPFSILLSIPFAFVGVYWALFLTKTSFDLMAGIGVILLIGVVVNNAIVLVDRIGELRSQGVDRAEAIALAGEQRLRPILMTAATTIFGLVPMAIGTTSLVGIPYSPLGRAVMGGLVASTLLTLFVVPLFYASLDDLRGWSRSVVVALLSEARRVGRSSGGRR